MTISLRNNFCTVSINTKGAELFSFKNIKTNTEFIWEGNPEFWGKHSPVLFPIVGALKNDSYQYNGETYHLSRHGFARDFEFEVIQSNSDFASFLLKSDTETLAKYPFEFEFQMDYQLNAKKLTITYVVRNKSDVQMPLSLGAHPAFALPNGLENYSLELEQQEVLITHELENNLFSGKTRKISLQNKQLPLSYSLFEKDALVFKTIESKKIRLKDNQHSVLEIDFEDFSSLGIWTVQNAPFICLEPWIGFADDASSKGNLFEKPNSQILEPNAVFRASFSISI